MSECKTGAQGAKRVFLQYFLRLLAAIFVCSVTLSGVFAQANWSATDNAASSGSQNGLSQGVQLDGDLEILYQDFKDGRHRIQYSLKKSDGTRVPLQFKGKPPV